MSFAETSCPRPNDEDLSLFPLIAALFMSSAFCLISLLFYVCYYIFRQRYNSRIQEQNQDIERGLSSQQQQQVTINISEDKVKEDPEACKFKKVSWTAFKQDIINNKSHRYNDDDDVYKTSTCAVCFDEFRDGDECKVRSECNHIFHQTCIGRWLDNQATCPLCRGSVPGTVWPYVTTAAFQSPD